LNVGKPPEGKQLPACASFIKYATRAGEREREIEREREREREREERKPVW